MTVSYQLIAGITGTVKAVKRTEPDQIDLCIRFDPDNTNYQEYLAWLAEGNEPLPADEPPAAE